MITCHSFFKDNEIGDDGLKILCNGIQKNETLRILKLSGNNISNEGVALLLKTLNKETSKISVLVLSSKTHTDSFPK